VEVGETFGDGFLVEFSFYSLRYKVRVAQHVPTPYVPETGKPKQQGSAKKLSGSPVSGARGLRRCIFASSEQL